MGSHLGAQDQDFQLDEKTPLKLVLAQVSQSQNVLFAYPTALVDKVLVDKTQFEYSSVKDLVSQLILGSDIEIFALDENQILLREKKMRVDYTTEVSGQIIDESTNEVLPFATIYSENFGNGVLADANGNFNLKCNSNLNENYIISFLGYEDRVMTTEELIQGKKIPLKQQSALISEVTISYIVPPTLISEDGQSLKLASKLISRNTPGLFGSDVLRNIQLLAGITAHDDDLASLKIRGSNAEGSKIIMDGIPLYNVNHYYGIFSAINGDFVSKASLYKNTQPIEYSDASGGLLVLNSENNKDESFNSVELNLMTVSAYFDNALSDNIQFQIAGRSSYQNVNDSKLINLDNSNSQAFSVGENQVTFFTNEPKFKFYDFNSSLKYSKDKLRISFNAFNSNDQLENSYDRATPFSNITESRTIYNNTEQWTNTGFSIMSDYQVSDNWTSSTTAHYTSYDYDSKINSELTRNQIMQSVENSNVIKLKEFGVSSFMSFNSDSESFKSGFAFNRYNIIHNLEIDRNMSNLNYDKSLSLFTLFAEYEKEVGPFILKAGMRTPFSNHKDKLKFFFSPISSLSYKIADNQILKASYNFSNQIVREIEYENRLGQNYSFYRLSRGKQFPILKTHKFMLGYTIEKGAFMFDVEAYYKSIDGAIQFLSPLTGFDETNNGPGTGPYQLFVGERRVAGVDVSINYNVKNYSTWLAYTLSKSEDRYKDLFRGKYFLSQNDRRHQFKWINNYRLGKVDLNASFIYANGRPYIPLESLDQIGGKNDLDPLKHQRQLPSYFRVDLGCQYNFQFGKTNAQVGLSVFNLFNRQNVKYIQYSHQVNGPGPADNNIVIGTGGDLLDRTLNLSFGISF